MFQQHAQNAALSSEDQMGESDTLIEISTCHTVTDSLCKKQYHRRLATCSIICGLSCLGILSMINSVKAEAAGRNDKERSEQLSKTARKYGIISIVVWVCILIMLPVLVVFVSYLLTLVD